jgi:hypothetical protein
LRAGQALRHEREAEGQSREHARFGP